MNLWLKLCLESEACFSRGDGLAGSIDVEVIQDEFGFPYLGGRALKGLLREEAAAILDSLQRCRSPEESRWQEAASRLFGHPGSHASQQGKIHVGDARLPEELRQRVAAEGTLKPLEVLESLTTVRQQTALDETGAPLPETLRTVRVILRDTRFIAHIGIDDEMDLDQSDVLAFFAACVMAFRRAGSMKTRGLGLLTAELLADPGGPAITGSLYKQFKSSFQAQEGQAA